MKTVHMLFAVGLASLSLLVGCGERLIVGTTSYSYAKGLIEPGTTVAVVPRGDSVVIHDWAVHKMHIESCLKKAGMVIVPDTVAPELICEASYSMTCMDDASTEVGHDFVLRFLHNADLKNQDAPSVAEIQVRSGEECTNSDKMIAAMTRLAFCGWPAEDGAKYDAGVGW